MDLHLYFLFAPKIITIILGLINKRVLSSPYKLLLAQVLLAICTDGAGLYIVKQYHSNNIWMFNTYILLEMWLVLIIGMMFTSAKRAKQVTLYTAALLTVYWCYNWYTLGMVALFTKYVLAYFIAVTILFVHVALNNAIFSAKKILQQPLFLVCIAFIVSSTAPIPYFGMLNYLNEADIELSNTLYYINHIAGIIRYWLVALAIYLYIRQAKREIAA